MSKFKRIALIRNIDAEPGDTLIGLRDFLEDNGCTVFPESSCLGALGSDKIYNYEQLKDCDLAIVIGGDGTLLNAARSLALYDIPIVGINTGRLGFLVDVPQTDLLNSLRKLLTGTYISEERSLLLARVERGEEVIAEQLALNDVVVNTYFQTRMIEFYTHVDDRYVNHERADGIVVATPTGSTAYALSAGGPILHPSLDAIALVPICPHTLNHRPLVIDASMSVSITIDPDCRVAAQASFDGQANVRLEGGDRVRIQRSDTNVKLLHPVGYDFFDILRAKLRWGKQPDDRSRR